MHRGRHGPLGREHPDGRRRLAVQHRDQEGDRSHPPVPEGGEVPEEAGGGDAAGAGPEHVHLVASRDGPRSLDRRLARGDVGAEVPRSFGGVGFRQLMTKTWSPFEVACSTMLRPGARSSTQNLLIWGGMMTMGRARTRSVVGRYW